MGMSRANQSIISLINFILKLRFKIETTIIKIFYSDPNKKLFLKISIPVNDRFSCSYE